ncbi:NADH dehydrogenase subunit A [Nitrosomonas marina]|uniref:NADH-quinone oxidoreductase subunit A n=1 Tax=Nitrosomonas marina TaxID=917 RepID=A0A1H8HXL0_9PROT|nr:NADH dehydrogenase subunit A [Nitrosomonas marina]
MQNMEPAAIIGSFSLLILFVLGSLLWIARWLGSYRAQWDKEQPFECGVPPTGDARTRMPVSFYVIAVSFLIFDIEAAFLFIWAVTYWELGIRGVIGACVFILILLFGLIYEWRKGGLEWISDKTPKDH